MIMKKFLLPILSLGLAFGLAASAHAQVIYEGFNYTIGNFNTGTSGPATTGTGLTGNWTWNQNGDANPRTTEIQSGSIDVRNLETSANKLNWGTAPGSGSASNYLYSALTAGATSSLGLTDGQSKTLWISYALTANTGGGTPTVELRNTAANAAGGIVFGISAQPQANTVQLLGNNGQLGSSGSFTFTNGQNFLLVAKLTMSLSGTTTTFGAGSVWVLNNTGSLPTDEIGLGAALVNYGGGDTSGADRTPGYLRISNGSSVASQTFDEIRIGTAFNQVVIPEPSTWALLTIGLTALVIFRRRKQAA